MNKVNVNISAPNLAVVCIDKANKEQYKGRLYDKYHKEATVFHDIGELLTRIEKLCDQSRYPQNTTVNHTFRIKGSITSGEEALQVADIDQILEQKGGLATFVVHVKYRQHSTWQGEIVWAEKNQKQTFRSALELLKLIDSALDDNTIESEES